MNKRSIRDFFIVLAMFLCFALMIIGLNSCAPNPGPDATVIKCTPEYIYFDDDVFRYGVEINKFEYNGHAYIKFGVGDRQTILHDPDCKCHKNNNETLFDW